MLYQFSTDDVDDHLTNWVINTYLLIIEKQQMYKRENTNENTK